MRGVFQVQRGRITGVVLLVLLLVSLVPARVSHGAEARIGQWEERWVLPYPHGMKQVIHDGSRYLALTERQLQSSADGKHWRSHTLPSLGSASLQQLLFFKERYYLLTSTELLVSTDLVAWESLDLMTTPALRAMVAGDDRIVLTGTFPVAGGFHHGVWTSTDGTNWSRHRVGPALERLFYSEGRFVGVAGNNLYRSNDGIAWSTAYTSKPLTHRIHDLAAGNGVLVAVGEAGVILRSMDGGTFWTVDSVPTGAHLHRVAYGAGRFVATGSRTVYYAWADSIRVGALFTSTDGKNWEMKSKTDEEASDVWVDETRGEYQGFELMEVFSYRPGEFLAAVEDGVGHRTDLYTSADGLHWQRTLSAEPRRVALLVYGNGLYLAATVGGELLLSPDLSSWDPLPSPLRPGSMPTALSYGPDGYLLAGDGALFRSKDGRTWTREQGVSGTIRALAHGGGRTIAVGDESAIFIYEQGLWRARPHHWGTRIHGIAFGNDRFVIISDHGRVAHSSDGNYWQEESSGTDLTLNGVAFGTDRFVVAAGPATEESGGPSAVLVSKDGRRWRAVQESSEQQHRSVAIGHDMYVIAGSHLLVAGDETRWTVTGGTFEYSLEPALKDQVVRPPLSVVAGPREFVAVWGPRLLLRRLVDLGRSSIRADAGEVLAGGQERGLITVYLADERGRPLPNRLVQLVQHQGRNQTVIAETYTDSGGRARFTVTNDAEGRITYGALVDEPEQELFQTVEIEYVTSK